MKSLLKIYGKYIGSTWAIILLLAITNFGIFFWIIGEQAALSEPVIIEHGLGRLENMGLEEMSDEGLILSQEGKEYLMKNKFLFLMVLNETGDVIYGWNLPEDLKTHYTVGEVASFSKWYLNDYPVKVWNTEQGLLVAGGEKNSIWKYTLEFPEYFMRRMGRYFFITLEINLLVIACVIVFLGYRYYKSLQPLTEGIAALSVNQRIYLSEKGVTAHLAAQVNQTSDLLERQREALNKRDAARTEWIAGVSHDIRTPLSMIVGYADELEHNESLCKEDKSRAAAIKIHSLKIKQLIEDLNLTSKLEYHMQPLRKKSFYPAALLRRLTAEKINGGLKEQYELILEIDNSLEGVTLWGDEELLARAIGNLLNNSIGHNPSGCHILISGSREEDDCVFQVSDDGCGIPRGVIESLEQENETEKMVQSEEIESTDQNKCCHTLRAGYCKKKPHIMGLRIVKQIVLAHKGNFQIKEEGHTVRLALPIIS